MYFKISDNERRVWEIYNTNQFNSFDVKRCWAIN